MNPSAARRLAVIGLDSVPAELLFHRWIDHLPNFRRLLGRGTWGVLRSCDPPITVPAWACMVTGCDPGELGIYGFRNRSGFGYGQPSLVHSGSLLRQTVWDEIGRSGKKSVILGVPPGYPPQALAGHAVSCFLTPSLRHSWAWPNSLRDEIEQEVPGYVFDVADFRTSDKAGLARRIREKSSAQFRLARHLATSKPWDFFMMVEMGPDRMQHAFWPSDLEPEGELFRYYEFLDAEVGLLLEVLGDANILLVSDHGAQAMAGGFYLNEWLLQNGYLCLREPTVDRRPLRPDMVDWTRTTAWGEGGYVGRIFLNVAGREEQGTVSPAKYESVRSEIAARLRSLQGIQGDTLSCEAWRPEDRYRECAGIPPDLMLYVDELRWRVLGSIGAGCLFDTENDQGPDGANHHPDGVFLWCPASSPGAGEVGVRTLLDVAPTILATLGLEKPAGMRGESFCGGGKGAGA